MVNFNVTIFNRLKKMGFSEITGKFIRILFNKTVTKPFFNLKKIFFVTNLNPTSSLKTINQ